MDLVGLLLIGVVLVFGSAYAAWTSWVVWQEARVNARKTKATGSAAPASTWLQHGLTLAVSAVFLSVSVSLCFSIAQGESCTKAVEQLKSLRAPTPTDRGLNWGEEGNHGTLHVSSDGQRVTGASLAYIKFDSSDLKQLVEQHPHIYWFILSGTQIDDRALELLAQRETVDALVLADTSITDHGVAALEGHPQLRELDLTRTAISDRSLESLSSLPALKHLNLCGTDVTDDGLKALEGNSTLLTLNIQETQISDAAIATLGTLESLKLLAMGNSKLSPDGIIRLQHTLPRCEVIQGVP